MNADLRVRQIASVDPPAESLLFAKSWNGTSARRQISANTARLNASVVYFWFAASLMTRPRLSQQRFASSCFSAWLGGRRGRCSQTHKQGAGTARR